MVLLADRPDVLDRIERRWSTHHDRGAHDYTDEGCRILAEHAFKDVPKLVRVARAARRTSRAWDPSPDGWSETEMGDEIEELRAALEELEADK